MLTDYKVNQMPSCELLSFLQDIGCNRMQFQLLRFWARHPKAKLSLYTIAYALDTARSNLRHSITSLVEKGILLKQCNSKGLTTYSLNSEQQAQKYIDELARLDWNEAKSLEKQLKEFGNLSANIREESNSEAGNHSPK